MLSRVYKIPFICEGAAAEWLRDDLKTLLQPHRRFRQIVKRAERVE
jgi:hypothetical protein